MNEFKPFFDSLINNQSVLELFDYSDPVFDTNDKFGICHYLTIVINESTAIENLVNSARKSSNLLPGFDPLRSRCNLIVNKDSNNYCFVSVWDSQVYNHFNGSINSSIRLHNSLNLRSGSYFTSNLSPKAVIYSAEDGLLSHIQIIRELIMLYSKTKESSNLFGAINYLLISAFRTTLLLWNLHLISRDEIILRISEFFPSLDPEIRSHLNTTNQSTIDLADSSIKIINSLISLAAVK